MRELDFEDLPDDPQLAFVRLTEHFDEQLKSETDHFGDNDDTRLYLIRHMNNIIGAARALGIDALSSWGLPDWDNTYNEHTTFDLAVKSMVLQIKIRNGRVSRVYSVELNTSTKIRIHNTCRQIRELIEESDLQDRKKNSLLSKLNLFEADVDRIRTRFDNAMLAFVDLADVASKGTEALKPINDLVTRIKELIGAAKNEEPERQQLPTLEGGKQIEPPQKKLPSPKNDSLDGEIPF